MEPVPSLEYPPMARSAAPKKKTSPVPAFLLTFALLLVIGFAGASLVPSLIQGKLEKRISQTLKLKTEIEKFQFHPGRHEVLFSLDVSNPGGFPDSRMARIGRVRVDYAFSGLPFRGMDVQRVETAFDEFRLIKNEKGDLNLPALPTPSGKTQVIDEWILNLGPLTFTDLSAGHPIQKTFNLDLSNEIYRNVKGIAGMAEILRWEILKRTGIEEKILIPEIKPIGGQSAEVQTGSVPAVSTAPESAQSASSPSPVPSVPAAG